FSTYHGCSEVGWLTSAHTTDPKSKAETVFRLGCKERLITVVASLLAADRLALNEEYLLVTRDPENFIRPEPADQVGKILRHALISRAEDLYDSGIVDERV